MTDQNQKKDAGKARLDLVPWNEFEPTPRDWPVDAVDQSLKTWWSGKPFPLDLSIPIRQIPGVAKVLAFGAQKYSPRGWEDGIAFSRIFAAACRHAAQHAAGEFLDEETGLPHESHFWCNVLFLVVLTARGRTDLDDRPAPVAAVRAKLDEVERLNSRLRDLLGGAPAPASETPASDEPSN